MKALWFGSKNGPQQDAVMLGLQSRWPDAQVETTNDLEQALALISRDAIDLVFVYLGGSSGMPLHFIQEARRISGVPILAVTGKETTELERVKALYQGADTIINENCNPMEAQGSVVAMFRRLHGNLSGLEETIQLGDLQISPNTCEVFLRGKPVRLTPTEFRLLQALVNRKGMVATHDLLTRTIWGEGTDSTVLRKYVQRLRGKLEDAADNPRWIITVPSIGYRLMVHKTDVNSGALPQAS